MAGFDPSEPRDDHGRWTNGFGASLKLPKFFRENIGNYIINEAIAFAPYRSKNVTNEQEDAEVRNAPEYKQFMEHVNNIASGLGLEIASNIDTWGLCRQ